MTLDQRKQNNMNSVGKEELQTEEVLLDLQYFILITQIGRLNSKYLIQMEVV